MSIRTHRKSLITLFTAIVLTAGCNPQGCNQWGQIATQIRDSDGDGWLDENKNQKIDVIVDSIDSSVQSQFETLSLMVDDRIVLDAVPARPTISINETVATSRYAGQWFIGQPQQYRARVKVVTGNRTSENATVGLLPFENKDETHTQTLTLDGKQFTFHYRSRLSTFSDPSPQDAGADSDRDGITDAEEAQLARQDNRVGDPTLRDIIIVEGFTRPKWALLKRSIERITTVFLNRGFNFLIADEREDFLPFTPGQILLPDGSNNALIVPAENRAVAVAEVPAVRPRHIPAEFAPFTHFLVAADSTPDADFGISNGVPGRNVVIRSHFFALGPDPFGTDYQAKDAMHELGHNFGLCHPNESDQSCPTGAIPQAERNGAASCMGSPADDGGLFNGPIPNVQAITNAFSRPLNYSPTQWANIAPQLSRGA